MDVILFASIDLLNGARCGAKVLLWIYVTCTRNDRLFQIVVLCKPSFLWHSSVTILEMDLMKNKNGIRTEYTLYGYFGLEIMLWKKK